jgi:hypothetical protein
MTDDASENASAFVRDDLKQYERQRLTDFPSLLEKARPGCLNAGSNAEQREQQEQSQSITYLFPEDRVFRCLSQLVCPENTGACPASAAGQ